MTNETKENAEKMAKAVALLTAGTALLTAVTGFINVCRNKKE